MAVTATPARLNGTTRGRRGHDAGAVSAARDLPASNTDPPFIATDTSSHYLTIEVGFAADLVVPSAYCTCSLLRALTAISCCDFGQTLGPWLSDGSDG